MVVLHGKIVETDDFGKDYLVLLQLRLDFAPVCRSDNFVQACEQFFHGRFPETLAAQVFDDYIYICVINRTEAHRKGFFVYFILRNRHFVSPVEIRNDAVRKIRVGVSVLIYQIVNQVKRFELVV